MRISAYFCGKVKNSTYITVKKKVPERVDSRVQFGWRLRNVNISKTKKRFPKRKMSFFLLLKSVLDKQQLFLISWTLSLRNFHKKCVLRATF